MPDETPQQFDKSKFSPSSWAADNPLTALFAAMFTSVLLSFGTNAVSNKTFAQNERGGISQDQADVRYLSKTEADARTLSRTKEMEELKKLVLTKEVFEAYHKADTERLDRIEKLIERILESR